MSASFEHPCPYCGGGIQIVLETELDGGELRIKTDFQAMRMRVAEHVLADPIAHPGLVEAVDE